MMKKSHVLIYFEFFEPQNIENIEETIRGLVKNHKFPPFRNIMIGVDYKNMKSIKYNELMDKIPVIITGGDIKNVGKTKLI